MEIIIFNIMKKFITLFAILAIANCSVFLRNLGACTASTDINEANADKGTCEDCGGTFTAGTGGGANTCACPKGKAFDTADPKGCKAIPCTITDITDTSVDEDKCVACQGKWDNGADTGKKCTCEKGYEFDGKSETKGCKKITCNVTDSASIEKASEGLCVACGLNYTSSKCACPDKGDSIEGETLCGVCDKEWDSDNKKCSGFNLKIAYALFSVLFLL